ncbi:MAG: hypothetical protein C4520_01190 [Candidatus Abyssobacteria bacterium SURF_5]|jgi:hypothetical protein|uniref:Uncharacterized protein n=1 Tax=Abyssobacteria bacterium (strain SURF_5) TaxID=2093360 RepID=A0A3A4P9I9_ABYX5|nr:MAG: hypothetical protein C4520_01190 [Candidatus Abyssubacteria bacterium SURF_5]
MAYADKIRAFPGYRRAIGGVFLTIGYILSPLSWWNDAIVNIPLAYVLAWIVSQFSARLFLPAMIAAYWATNIAGLLLMHLGGLLLFRKEATRSQMRLGRLILISTIYTLVIGVLAKLGLFPHPF